ncbi:MBL fold metallo-hydrolase [Sphingomonas sp. So64.6b]|uniref:MBL fold metallo-hydrolase n=1 Tax=Sphingomonas sp. So64.6b TaxID=2997354 RepID=UPI0016047701|nr:MBL fold metallo-hydrolase [Sphingomonas sp. So64.6b]QNA84355.1 MBL fold metallo-hydrolase [Sphingomonas sp. So64.6b]
MNGTLFASLITIAFSQPAGPSPTGAHREALDRICRPFAASGAAGTLSGARFAPEQAQNPETAAATIQAHQTMLLLPDGRFMLGTSALYPGDIEFRFRTIGSPAGEDTVDLLGWREGDVLQHDDAASAVKDHADLRLLIPGLLACDALERKASDEAGLVRYTDAAGRVVALRFSGTGELQQAEIGSETYRYDGWSADAQQPRQIVRLRDGREIARWTDMQIAPTQAADVQQMALPPGYRPADDPGPLRATPLGHGAYRVDGTASGYHTGFVVGSREVALFDAPIGVDDAKAVRALIERTAPNRRIAHVIASHVHNDHMAGLPAYPDAEVVTGIGGGIALRRQLGATLPAHVREISTATEIDLGDRIIRIYPLASSHASTMLVGYDARSRSVFQGDLFYLPERGKVPAAFRTGTELAGLIRNQKLGVDHIVGVHGRTATMTDLQQGLALFDKGAESALSITLP